VRDELILTETADSKVINFVSTALQQNKLSGLSEMLRAIAEAVDAYACVLWQVAPNAKLDADPPQGTLFVLAQWVRDNRYVALYNLPLQPSVSGHAVLTQRPKNVDDISKEPLNFLSSFQTSAGIKSMCAVPIIFVDGKKGTVNVYRNRYEPFKGKEIETVERLASLVPALHQTIRDRVSLKLISSIDAVINDAEFRSRETPLAINETKAVFKIICDEITDTFNCIEASLFLNVPEETKPGYQLMATTWKRKFKKAHYSGMVREGVTGWVLARAKPVKIFDLVNFERDKEQIQTEYPDLIWRDSLDIEQSAREILQITNGSNLPPLSFMAAPIVIGEEVLGMIRACTATEGPYYFADRELELLTLIATQVGRYASNWFARHQMLQENESWHALVRSVTRLNRFVQKELTRPEPNELRIFDEALKLTSSVISGAEVMDVRLFDDKTNQLYFATTHGPAWAQGDEAEIDERRSRRFPITKSNTSAGAYVFNRNRLYVVENSKTDPYYSETFPFVKRMIIAPISVEREKFGVLDIRAIKESVFPKHAEAIAELLGQQLGLYHYLSNTIGKLRKAEVGLTHSIHELTTVQKQQAQTFEDLEHQLRSPIIQAYARINALIAQETANGGLRSSLQAIRGLCAKAKRVAMSAGLFAKLAREEAIELNRKRLTYEYLVKMLTEAAADHELLVDSRKRIRFHIDRRNYEVLRMARVEVDHELLEQAISNLLDNAGKYSYEETRVDVAWGFTSSDRFHITVANRGLPIRSSEATACRGRGWRGSMAAATTGEGSGIGLWIVDSIMHAHNGQLLVTPTTASGVTEIKLVFPAMRG
jgi:signal transduction histidine kinase